MERPVLGACHAVLGKLCFSGSRRMDGNQTFSEGVLMFSGIMFAGFGVLIGWNYEGVFLQLCEYSERGRFAVLAWVE
jgi:hypothetical protein